MWRPWAWRRGRTGGVVDKISGCVVREQRPAVSTNTTSGPARVTDRHHHHHHRGAFTTTPAPPPLRRLHCHHLHGRHLPSTLLLQVTPEPQEGDTPWPGTQFPVTQQKVVIVPRREYPIPPHLQNHHQFTIYFSLPGRRSPLTSHTTPCSRSGATFEAHCRHWTLEFRGEKREGSRQPPPPSR